jgi:hypothetical protein
MWLESAGASREQYDSNNDRDKRWNFAAGSAGQRRGSAREHREPLAAWDQELDRAVRVVVPRIVYGFGDLRFGQFADIDHTTRPAFLRPGAQVS